MLKNFVISKLPEKSFYKTILTKFERLSILTQNFKHPFASDMFVVVAVAAILMYDESFRLIQSKSYSEKNFKPEAENNI